MLCGGDPSRFKGLDARFSSPVMPGETLKVNAWLDGDGSAVFQTCGQDGRIVIDAGRVTYSA
jgi:acyl dehydratase